jgi:hypothetical protein
VGHLTYTPRLEQRRQYLEPFSYSGLSNHGPRATQVRQQKSNFRREPVAVCGICLRVVV